MADNNDPIGGGDGADDGFRPYPNVNHPEDQPGYSSGSQQNPYGSYGDPAGGYGTPNYGDYAGGAAGRTHFDLGTPMVAGGGKPEIGTAIKYGFKATFKNPLIWILGTAVYMFVLVLVPGFMGGFEAGINADAEGSTSFVGGTLNFVTSILAAILAPFIYRLSLRQVDGEKKLEFTDATGGFSWLNTFLTDIIVGFVTFIVCLLAAIPLFAAIFTSIDGDSPNVALLIIGFILLFAAILITVPFSQFMAYYIADGRPLGEGLKLGFSQIKAAFWPTLGFIIVLGLLAGFGTLITLIIGAVIFIPMSINANAYAYRQISGGQVPSI